MKAILIDDEPSILETIKIMLERMGWECMALSDGVELETHLEKFRPDVVITDYNLPGENGLEIARKVKMKGIPCAIITGLLASQLQAKEADTICIQKPFTPKELDMKINELLLMKQ